MDPELPPEEPIVEPTPEPTPEPVPPLVPPYIDPNARVIYRLPDNGVGVLIPAVGCGLTLEEIIAKDVPAGAAYRVVDVSTIPSDRTFRAAWEWVD